jgi:D-alanyl-D-alanine dipeptidase
MKVNFRECGHVVQQTDDENDQVIEMSGECFDCLSDRSLANKVRRMKMEQLVKDLETKLFGGELGQ